MFRNFFLKKQLVIGVEIQPEEVCLVQLKQTRKEFWLENMAVAALPAMAVVEDKINDIAAVRHAIESLVRATNTYGQVTAIALPSQTVITHQIKLTENLTDEECETEIQTNLQRYLPGVTEALSFDFFRESANAVLVVAARQQQLNDYVNVVNAAGLRVKIVDSSIYALIRGACFIKPNQAIAVLIMHSLDAQLIVFQPPTTLFMYPIRIEDFEQQLRQVAQVCYTTHRHLKLDSIMLSGKKAFWFAKKAIIEQVFQLPTYLADPFAIMQYASHIDVGQLQQSNSQRLVSCGLALRNVLS